MQVNIKLLSHGIGLDLPSQATIGSAGLDLRAAVTESIVLKPMERQAIPTGICFAVPAGYNAELRPRSGLAFKHGITILNTPGTIDSDYRGEIKVLLINFSSENFTIERGMRIAQVVFQKYETIEWNQVDSLDETKRAEGGYGSTGIR